MTIGRAYDLEKVVRLSPEIEATLWTAFAHVATNSDRPPARATFSHVAELAAQALTRLQRGGLLWVLDGSEVPGLRTHSCGYLVWVARTGLRAFYRAHRSENSNVVLSGCVRWQDGGHRSLCSPPAQGTHQNSPVVSVTGNG